MYNDPMEKKEQSINTQGRGPVTGHYRTLEQAVVVASLKCLVWREVEEGKPYTLKDFIEYVNTYDTEHPLRPEQFYIVSREGAIGISPGLEWMTVWIFIPMEPCKERDFALRNMLEEYHTETEVEEALEKAVTEGLAREKAAKAAAAQAAVRPQAPVPPPTLGLATPPPPAPPMPRR